jgi:hypothetical protein
LRHQIATFMADLTFVKFPIFYNENLH